MNGHQRAVARMLRQSAMAVLMTLLTLVIAAPPALAHPRPPRSEKLLAAFWKELFSKTTAEATPTICLRFDHRALTPFILSDTVNHVECDAREGDLLYMTGYTYEQSSSEEGPGWTPESLRAAAIKGVRSAPPVATYDGRPLELPLVVTKPTRAALPEDDLIGTDDRETVFVAAAWVTTIRLRRGTHTVVITDATGNVFTTTLHVSC